MPLYEYLCQECEQQSELLVTLQPSSRRAPNAAAHG